MSKRSYSSSVRADAAAEKRERMIEAATQFFREEHGIQDFSLEAVGRAVGVTRVTVYNQFGSRNGLLEAVFDEVARKGGIVRLAEVEAVADPRAALHRIVEIYCEFWSSDAAIGRLHDAMATDPAIAQALAERMARGWQVLVAVIARIAVNQAGVQAQRDTADLIATFTSLAAFRMLAKARPAGEVCSLLKAACDDAVERMMRGSTGR
ncbi:TetR/AcrR family transcriptional regulator [Undibacterium sp.]|uniref:TetR/AcrR family transcriptional regulator n=1 Tax=Undibacterium sp. TaxID=1914977 RepID=UPI00374D0C73